MGYHSNKAHGGGKVWTVKMQGEEGVPVAELGVIASEDGLLNTRYSIWFYAYLVYWGEPERAPQ